MQRLLRGHGLWKRAPQATVKACTRVKSKFEALFEPEPPILPCLSTANTAPVVDLNSLDGLPETGTTATFVSFGGAVPIALDVAITDDGTVITSATIELKNPVEGENETLALTPEGEILLAGLNGGEGGRAGPTAGTDLPSLTITGHGDFAQYEQLIQQVVYDNGVDAPVTGDRTIEVTVSDGAADGSATSVMLVEHGCPCSSFTNEAVVTPGLLDLFARTEDRCSPQTDWCWRNASCNVVTVHDRVDALAVWFLLAVGERVFERRVAFGTVADGGCRVEVHTDNGGKLPYLQTRDVDSASVNRPNEVIEIFTADMQAACRARIPIQIERLRATFYAGGDDGHALNCAP